MKTPLKKLKNNFFYLLDFSVQIQIIEKCTSPITYFAHVNLIQLVDAGWMYILTKHMVPLSFNWSINPTTHGSLNWGI